MRKVGNDLDGNGVLLRVNPEIAEALQGDERGVLREVEQVVGRKVTVRPDAYLHHEQFDVMSLVITVGFVIGLGPSAFECGTIARRTVRCVIGFTAVARSRP